jgi:hypothetical protein
MALVQAPSRAKGFVGHHYYVQEFQVSQGREGSIYYPSKIGGETSAPAIRCRIEGIGVWLRLCRHTRAPGSRFCRLPGRGFAVCRVATERRRLSQIAGNLKAAIAI